MDGEFGLGLPLEEGIVQLLVIDVDLPHFGTNLLPHLRLHRLLLLLGEGIWEVGDTQSVPNTSGDTYKALKILEEDPEVPHD